VPTLSDSRKHAQKLVSSVEVDPSIGRRQPAIAFCSSGFRCVETSSGISSVVEAITHSKEYILNEMSRLLDDRLAGLDEVVVELIRTKSENDALRTKINTLSKEKQELVDEVESFKPVQFGFYKKVRK